MRKIIAIVLMALTLSGCSTSMSVEEAGEKVLYLFCGGNGFKEDLRNALVDFDLSEAQRASGGLAAIHEKGYEEFSNFEQWPESVQPEIQRLASLYLIELDLSSRMHEAWNKATTFKQGLGNLLNVSGFDAVGSNERGQLSTALRVKLNLSLDRESSCLGY